MNGMRNESLRTDRVASTGRGVAWLCIIAAFLGAGLLFQVQPLISKMILPWFGGSPAVWTTCMLFFQVLLLVGYAYADGLSRIRNWKKQAWVHVPLLVAACATLPISRAEAWRPHDSTQPISRILLLLTVSVGLPYLVVSTTGPLVQTWFARAYPGRSPYRLYAVSNLGSLLALLSYPVWVEPLLAVRTQALCWSAGFIGFAVITAWLVLSHGRHTVDVDTGTTATQSAKSSPAPSWSRLLRWLLLPALASLMLLAVTNQLCQNVAVVPMLWIAPLSIYLFSFILCFDRERWYVPRWYALGAAVSVVVLSKLLLAHHFTSATWYFEPLPIRWFARSQKVHIASYLIGLFLICMVCHGETVRSKPSPRFLTRFYLCIAAGGAIGGLVVSLLCPLLFSTYLELNIGLLISLLVSLWILFGDGREEWFRRPLLRRACLLVSTIAVLTVVAAQFSSLQMNWLVAKRNFYGVLTVTEEKVGLYDHAYTLFSGASYHGGITEHGKQYLHPELRHEPTLYYTPTSGVGLTLLAISPPAGRRIGVIGLGVGTVAAYGTPKDTFRFYEINPLVKELALERFTFIKDSAADATVVLGDGRLLLEREPPQHFDVLMVDAFSGDSIPTHLLTQEAFALYLHKHLHPQGVLAVHVSNRYLDLIPVVARQAEHFQIACVLIKNHHLAGGGRGAAASEWLLLTHNVDFLRHAAIAAVAQEVLVDDDTPRWTDQQNNLWQLLIRGQKSGEP